MSDIVKRLEIKAGVMEMGERIAWGSDTALMREAAHQITTLTAEVARLTGELDEASARLHEVATLCATVEQERDRLTAELAEAQRQRLPEGYITIPCEAWDAQMKIEGELERSRQECARLREALASLICATRHLNPCPGTVEQALAALSASGREVNDAPAE